MNNSANNSTNTPVFSPYLLLGIMKHDSKTIMEAVKDSFRSGGVLRLPAVAEDEESVIQLVKDSQPNFLPFSILSLEQLQTCLKELLEFSQNQPAAYVYVIDESFSEAQPNPQTSELISNVSCFQVVTVSAEHAIAEITEIRPDVTPFGAITSAMLADYILSLKSFAESQYVN